MAKTDPIIAQADRRRDGSAKGFTEALRRWMLRFARSEAAQLTDEIRASDLRKTRHKAKTRSEQAIEDELRELFRAFGIRRFRDTARGTGRQLSAEHRNVEQSDIVVPESLTADFLAEHEPRLQKIIEETRTATRQSVADIIRAAQASEARPSIGDVARRIRNQFHGDVGAGGEVVGSVPVIGRGILPTEEITTATSNDPKERGILYAFSSERAAMIARTEMAIADSSGQQAGYIVSGIGWIEWLAVIGDRKSGEREHWRMNKKRVRVGERFHLPDGTKMKHPHDTGGTGNVVGNIINCRCGSRAVRRGPNGER